MQPIRPQFFNVTECPPEDITVFPAAGISPYTAGTRFALMSDNNKRPARSFKSVGDENPYTWLRFKRLSLIRTTLLKPSALLSRMSREVRAGLPGVPAGGRDKVTWAINGAVWIELHAESKVMN